MRYSIQPLLTLIACLSLTSLAGAQTTTTGQPPLSQSPAAGAGSENPPPTAAPLPPPDIQTGIASPAPPGPAAPVAPAAFEAVSAAAPPSTQNPPTPPAAEVPRSRTHDCSRNWIRDGFYMRIGSGLGDVHIAGNGPKGAASLHGLGSNELIAIGGSIVRGLVLAGAIQGSSTTTTFEGGPFVDEKVTSNGGSAAASSRADASFSALGLLVDWYPNPSDGWHVGLSAGFGFTSVKNRADDSTMTGTSAAGNVFAGYDWAIGPAWSIGLSLVGGGALSASMKDSSDQPDTGYRLRSYSLGISASFLYF